MNVSIQGNPKALPPEPALSETELPVEETPGRVVPTLVVTEAAEMLMEADYEVKKAIIDNLKPSERETKLRKESQKAARKKADEQKAREEEEKQARYEKDELERLRNQMV